MNYYNDNDPKACAWLRELIAAGELPPGDVDERSITEVHAHEIEGYTQAHFFAGIGGWPLALRWAGLENEPGIWTGSPPCQPLSCAGKRQGHADERHLWPAFHGLIAKRRPSTIFGEQVASKDGREWFAGIRLDLEDLGYACGGADLCAASVGAPHRRQRLFWLADLPKQGRTARRPTATDGRPSAEPRRCRSWGDFDILPCRDGKARRCPTWGLEPIFQLLADGVWCNMVSGWSQSVENVKERTLSHAKETEASPGEVLRAMREASEQEAIRERAGGHDAVHGATILLFALLQLEGPMGQVIKRDAPGGVQDGGAGVPALRGQAEQASRSSQERRLDGQPAGKLHDLVSALSQELAQRHEEPACIAVACMGGPLTKGIPGRMGLLRGYGNAIVPQVAEAFIRAAREAIGDLPWDGKKQT